MIDVDALTKTFSRSGQDRPVLEGVTLHVAAGQIAGVIGPSGAGKSTLARCVNLLERPTAGKITVDSVELSALSERRLQAARRRIGTIFQAASLLSSRTVSGNVALPLELAGGGRRDRQTRVAELVERVGLASHADAYPAQLSGGQRQRVGIARALALRPVVLLSDEATSGLDPSTTRTILALLRELRDDLGLTIMLITHEMDVVRDVCDHVTLLRDGRVAESGTVAELVCDPASDLGRALVPDRPHLAPAPGQVAWRIGYVNRTVDSRWLQALEHELDAPVELLGGAIEAVEGAAAGHVILGVPADRDDLPLLLAPRGLHAAPVGAVPVAETIA